MNSNGIYVLLVCVMVIFAVHQTDSFQVSVQSPGNNVFVSDVQPPPQNMMPNAVPSTTMPNNGAGQPGKVFCGHGMVSPNSHVQCSQGFRCTKKMIACNTQQSSIQLPPITYPRQCLRTIPCDSKMSCRKRILSEQTDYCNCFTKYDDHDEKGINKRTKTGLLTHESKGKYQRHEKEYSEICFFESIRHCRSAPGVLHRQSLTHAPFTYIKNVSSSHTTTFLPSLSKTTTATTFDKDMLLFQQKPVLVNEDQVDNDNPSIYLTSSQLAAYMTTYSGNINPKTLVIDCGSPLRHTERRIQDSLLLHVNDKISRKRLLTRGLKNFLDSHQLNRLDKNEIIVLYDDSIRSSTLCASSTVPMQLSSSMKCVYDEIKRHDTNKTIYILQSSFDEFYQHYPSLCRISTSTDEDLSSLSLPESAKPIDIESFQISEVFPGLYLGGAHDSEDLNLLKQHEIKTIINVSTSIPCHFENERVLEYLRVPCHDSANQNILQYFETTFEYIHEKLSMNKNVLVHCQGGVSRSPSFVIGYLMKYHSKTFDEAYNLVKTKRSIINPNFNFLGQLTQYQQVLIST